MDMISVTEFVACVAALVRGVWHPERRPFYVAPHDLERELAMRLAWDEIHRIERTGVA